MKRSKRLAMTGVAILVFTACLFVPRTVAAQAAGSNLPTPAQTSTDPTAGATPVPRPTATEPSAAPAAPPQQSADDRLPFMDGDRGAANAESPGAMGLLMRTLGALLLIVGLIVAAAYGMRRFGGARFGATREDAPELSVLASVGLGDRRSLAIVRFGEKTLLVGSTAQTITLLAAGTSATLPTPSPVRSVADMLQSGEMDAADSFDYELSIATEDSARRQEAWRERGGGAA